MVTTTPKPTIDTCTKKRKESKGNTKDSHQITKEEKGKKKYLQKQTQNN